MSIKSSNGKISNHRIVMSETQHGCTMNNHINLPYNKKSIYLISI